MDIVHCGQDAPDAIHLRPIPIHFGYNQEDWEQEAREGEARNERICGDVEDLESMRVRDAGVDLLGKVVELGNVRRDGLAPFHTICKGVGNRESHRHLDDLWVTECCREAGDQLLASSRHSPKILSIWS